MAKIVIFIYVMLILSGCLYSQDVQSVKVKVTKVKTSNEVKVNCKVVKYDGIKILVPVRYMTKFKNDKSVYSDTIDFTGQDPLVKIVKKHILSELLIKKKAYLYAINDSIICNKVYCRYYYEGSLLGNRTLIFSDFYLQKKFSYDVDSLFFQYSKYWVSKPNRLQ
ncbi:MAG: hypothetical protein RMJ53_07655 [Chitinophagales bacterium]|nr:hypothetical protein [Chitinophagales bacterium]